MGLLNIDPRMMQQLMQQQGMGQAMQPAPGVTPPQGNYTPPQQPMFGKESMQGLGQMGQMMSAQAQPQQQDPAMMQSMALYQQRMRQQEEERRRLAQGGGM